MKLPYDSTFIHLYSGQVSQINEDIHTKVCTQMVITSLLVTEKKNCE
jgi:hypothetical protein